MFIEFARRLTPQPLYGIASSAYHIPKGGVVRAYRALGLRKRAWRSALPAELAYWEEWIRSKGKNFSLRVDPNRPLQQKLVDLLARPEGEEVRILDVGSGPLTTVGMFWPGRTVRITPIDALAKEYNRQLDKHGVVPPVRTQMGEAENLQALFEDASFDLAYACNALDHCVDAVRAVYQMVAMVKPGHYVLLEHFVDEGEHAEYHGLHQWNFHVEDGQFWIAGRGRSVNMTEELSTVADLVESDLEIRTGRTVEEAESSSSEAVVVVKIRRRT